MLPVGPEAQIALWAWLQRLEDAAIDALQEDWSIDLLETELLRLGLPPEPAPNSGNAAPGGPRNVPGQVPVFNPAAPASMESFFALCASTVPMAHGPCLWYNEADISAPRIFCSPSLGCSVAPLWKG